MEKVKIIPYDVITDKQLPVMTIDHLPANGDPIEIGDELYFVCELVRELPQNEGTIRVIPLVVRNPSSVKDIKEYINCLSIAHRKVRFRNEKGLCDLENCDEMIIS